MADQNNANRLIELMNSDADLVQTAEMMLSLGLDADLCATLRKACQAVREAYQRTMRSIPGSGPEYRSHVVAWRLQRQTAAVIAVSRAEEAVRVEIMKMQGGQS